MAVTDTDCELLDTYLDGELPREQCESLWRRMAEEPELNAELDRFRADRAVRQEVFASMEPSQRSVERVAANIAWQARRRQMMMIASKSLAAVTAVAACLLFGFTVGWVGHEKYPGASPAAVLTGDKANGIQMINDTSRSGHSAKFIVNVKDDSGRVIATQQFDSLQEAREFADDVSRSQMTHRDLHESPIVPVSDQY